jgi:hypothetical protein
MGVSNRDLDVSEQKKALSAFIGTPAAPVVTGATVQMVEVPFQSELKAVSVVGFGFSGAPTAELKLHRFIPGSGATIITGLAASIIIPAMGVSGPLSMSLVAAGSTLLQCLAGDVLVFQTGTANTSTDRLGACFVLKALQDFKADFGSAT